MRYLFLILCVLSARTFADVLVLDNFDSYAPGKLDKNDAASPNSAPNGSGNPWWGAPSGTTFGNQTNTQFNVVTAQNGVTPHSSAQMIRGTNGTAERTEIWQNVAFRKNGGAAFTGNLTYDWWFYDPNGATSGRNYQANGALVFYSDNSATADYPDSQTVANSSSVERLTLGASNFTTNTAGYPQTFDPTLYQARVVNAPGGYNSVGWFNVPLTRSVGWHHAQIVVGPADATKANAVSFYIDNLTTPLLTATTVLDLGYNAIELTAPGTAAGYFDDARLISTPEPALLSLPLLATVLLGRRRRRSKIVSQTPKGSAAR